MDIKKRVEVLKREEYTLNKKLEKYILKIQKDFLKKENWFIHNEKEISIFTNEKLIIDYSGKSNYIPFLEKTINFSKTSIELEVNNIDEYNFNFTGKNLFKGNIRMFIIEYSKQGEKLRLNSYPLSTKNKLKFNEDTSYIRFAIRTEGTGTSVIENLSFEAEEKTEEELFYLPKKSKEPKKIKDLNVIFIGDEFTTRSFDPEFNTIKVSPENWKKEIEGIDIDFFFCESAWQGNEGKWTNKVGSRGPRDNTILLELVDWCKKHDIKTVFWNKEDPVHYNAFIDTAIHFDYIFTTDRNSITKYEEMGCKNVWDLSFAAQLKYHNPVEKFIRKDKVVFAGSYYGEKFPERTKIMNEMLEISKEFGLDIFDRNYKNHNNDNQFPEHFKDKIIGDLVGDEIDEAYKGYKVSINVNSVIDSPTMFARRVFELLACNTPIVSSGSLGIVNMFKGVVVASQDKEILKKELELLFNDDDYYEEKQKRCLREVLEKHTYKHRVEKILNLIDIQFVSSNTKISTISLIKSKEDAGKILKILDNQTNLVLEKIFILDYFEGYLEFFNEFNKVGYKTYTLEYIVNYRNISEIINNDYIIPISPSKSYKPNYIKDLALAINYSKDKSIITNNCNEKMYSYINEFEITSSMIPVSLLNTFKSLDFITQIDNKKNILGWGNFGIDILNINNN